VIRWKVSACMFKRRSRLRYFRMWYCSGLLCRRWRTFASFKSSRDF